MASQTEDNRTKEKETATSPGVRRGRFDHLRSETSRDTAGPRFGSGEKNQSRWPRNSQGRGRGRNKPAKRPVEAFVSNFEAFRKSCQAASYRVHHPRCDCSAIRNILGKEITVAKAGILDADSGVSSVSNAEFQAGSMLQPEILNGIIILPQVRTPSSFFFSPDTAEAQYADNPKQIEEKVKSEVFSDPDTANEFKVSCAACLLQVGCEPNGFSAVCSTNRELVDQARDRARDAATNKSTPLHADHAHHVITLPRNSLERYRKSKTRQQTQQALDELTQLLVQEGVPVEPETQNINLQHHLTALLDLTNDQRVDEFYWLVIVYDDTDQSPKKKSCWSLDLAGGKRHLGETAQDAAIRETEEETSLVWNEDWIQDIRQSKRPADSVNKFYLLTPPV